MKCRICGNEAHNREYLVAEMMLGLKEQFPYFQCSACDCLQIATIPGDMSRYYPSNYYSYAGAGQTNGLKQLLMTVRDRYALLGGGLIGKILYQKFPRERLEWLKRLGVTKNSRILDVGCGTGALLHSLRELGCENVLGVDPFLDHDLTYPNGLRVLKREIDNVDGEWDCVMFHHSFEHLAEPAKALEQAKKRLAPQGVCLIAIPVVAHAWKEYGTDWVQLDAPRHFHIHSEKSMELLAERQGMQVAEVLYNSSAFQFWGSEQYRQGIPLRSPRSYAENPANSNFSKDAIQEYTRRAHALNKERQGDCAVFFLRDRNPQSGNA